MQIVSDEHYITSGSKGGIFGSYSPAYTSKSSASLTGEGGGAKKAGGAVGTGDPIKVSTSRDKEAGGRRGASGGEEARGGGREGRTTSSVEELATTSL